MASVTAIYLRPSSRTPVRRVESAQAVVGRGLSGDHSGSRTRQVTLLDLDAWRAACHEIGRELDPGVRRANVVIEGQPLAGTRGRRIRLGDVLIEIVGETVPCRLMQDSAAGLQAALAPDWRGGVYGRVECGGEIVVGAPVTLEP